MVSKKATKVIKAVKAVKVKKTAEVEPTKGIRASVVGMDGKAAGSVTLPAELFGAKINKQLMAQAVRVYLANQRGGHASTKTRGEVQGSTRKIYKQKGTGKARHGGIRAPIFVGGGIVFGPRPRDYSLGFPQKMRKVALASALTEQLKKQNVIVVSGLSDVAKTKVVAAAFTAVGATRKTLLVTAKDCATVVRAGRNIEDVDILPASDLNTYSVLMHGKVVFMKEAIGELKK
ncbi:MAG: 50S ribosomal protein L4 [Candidatus Gottesmanbacteria bacterium]|nr:50S ribosomal protein L4 [Candidatus Gottesmanbacteria bacterium]